MAEGSKTPVVANIALSITTGFWSPILRKEAHIVDIE
jgi:hypothetical protein